MVKRSNTWQDAYSSGYVDLNVGDGLAVTLPIGDVLATSKSYTDAGDAANLAAGKTYADGVGTAAASAGATSGAAAAKVYTDSKDAANRVAWGAADAANRSDWAAADTAKLAAAKSHTDAQVALDRTRITDTEAKNDQQDTRLSKVEAVSPKVSNIALDTDGVPYYSPGSTEVHIIQDTDGVPYFIRFMSAQKDDDNTPYFGF